MRKTKHAPFVAACAAGLLLLAGCTDEVGPETGEDEATEPSPAEETEPEEADGTAEPNEADIEYAANMILHHEQAVEMSEILLAKDDVEPEVASLAEAIQDAQGPEIAQMEAWLEDWGYGPDEDGSLHHGEHDDHSAAGHQGMLGDEEIEQLTEASGPEASRLFLQQMIIHHQGAVLMAEEHLENGQHPEALALSEDVVSDQSAEIEEMQELLEQLQ
ncbi:DUF305 domain-containing protein [Bogoriella caseilytica]|uniref:Uncharacterized protein (DUF305 family) n=1 Tax=Bogoriella caseilytica TaxID=56055 RepID=A0A3N2BGJ1_9MICO|nr:DUF305 domain-containing protein [Bogoriella caseilytica]ROR74373.1 uncharacterized protein (DUF305 family) [Bogoriella caseilytica]